MKVKKWEMKDTLEVNTYLRGAEEGAMFAKLR